MSYIAYSSYSLVGLYYTPWNKGWIPKYGEFSIAYFICFIISHYAFMQFIYHFCFYQFYRDQIYAQPLKWQWAYHNIIFFICRSEFIVTVLDSSGEVRQKEVVSWQTLPVILSYMISDLRFCPVSPCRNFWNVDSMLPICSCIILYL